MTTAEQQYESTLAKTREVKEERDELLALQEMAGWKRLLTVFEDQMKQRRNQLELTTPAEIMDLLHKETLRAEVSTLRLFLEYVPNRLQELNEAAEILNDQAALESKELEEEE